MGMRISICGMRAMSKFVPYAILFVLMFSQQYQTVCCTTNIQSFESDHTEHTRTRTAGMDEWHIYNVTSDRWSKGWVSLAVDSQSIPYVLYMVLARPALLNLSFWNGNGWFEETTDGGSINVSLMSSPSSLAVDTDGGIHIAYRRRESSSEESALMYASNPNGTWNIETVESGDHRAYFGSGSALVLDANGYPRITYRGDNEIRYAKWDGVSWISQQVDPTPDVDGPTSLALDSKSFPHVTYMRWAGDKTDRYARWNGSEWSIRSLEHHHWRSRIAVDSDDIPHIVCAGVTGGPLPSTRPLVYARLVNNVWESEVLFPGYAFGLGSDIALDSNGHPHIAYLSIGDAVNYARWDGTNWTTEVVDKPLDVGGWLSLVLDRNDIPFIAYKKDEILTETVRIATKAKLAGNLPPVANSGDNYLGQEGSEIAFDGSKSNDPEGGVLSYSWDFDASVDSNGDGDFTNDPDGTGPTPTHTYGDNGNYTVTLKVTDDAGQWDTDTCIATVLNVAPTANADGPYQGDEPHTVQFIGTFTDPGFLDTHTFQWDFDYDGIAFNVDSTEQNPTRQWLDDYDRDVAFKVTDDDGGWDIGVTHVTINNVAPTASANGPYEGFEGTPIAFQGSHTDPGTLDTHTYEWDLEYDGITFSPDKTGSMVLNTWFDDHSGNIALKVTDDDGGWGIDVTTVTIENVPPIADAGDDKEGYEVSTFTFSGSFYDPGKGDTHTFEWDFDYDGISFDVDATGQSVSHTWIDDFDGEIGLRVTDDDGGVGIDTSHVLVKNVPPTVTLEVLPVDVDVSIRIAGEKWHDVSIELYEDGVLVANGSLIRYPGSPNDQMLTLTHLDADISKKYSAIVRYTPEDDPVNGQPSGANPCWIILRFNDGQELWLHHTFNVQHEDTYIWEVDLTAAILSHGITFEATAYDPGADDLTFHWDFGDGTNITNFYPNVNRTFPVEITETITHVFPGSGTYPVTLTVEDDDRGVVVVVVIIIIP
ncbi:MAG: PKD domain-containing protein [Methanomassiliicoccales archaeon]|nr:MAG: PKD domain-containing protein [Methanomassiliicoccales archaeon]